jgi:hypothetical protein
MTTMMHLSAALGAKCVVHFTQAATDGDGGGAKIQHTFTLTVTDRTVVENTKPATTTATKNEGEEDLKESELTKMEDLHISSKTFFNFCELTDALSLTIQYTTKKPAIHSSTKSHIKPPKM